MTCNREMKLIAAAMLIVLLAGVEASAQTDTKAEIEKLRAEIAKLRDEIKGLKDAQQGNKETGPMYRGRSVRFWIDQLDDADPKFRRDAIHAIGMLALRNKGLAKEKNLIAILAGISKENDGNYPSLAESATWALSAIGPDSVSALSEMAEDRTLAHQDARLAAIATIISMGPKAKTAVPVLIRTLQGRPSGVLYRQTLAALGSIGPDAKEAIPVLVDMMDKGVSRLAKDRDFFYGYDDSDLIVSTLVRIEPKIDEIVPRVKQEIPGGPMGGGPGIGIGSGGSRLLRFREAEQQWRQAIDELKKKYPAAK